MQSDFLRSPFGVPKDVNENKVLITSVFQSCLLINNAIFTAIGIVILFICPKTIGIILQDERHFLTRFLN